jgi:hypothetical protein
LAGHLWGFEAISWLGHMGQTPTELVAQHLEKLVIRKPHKSNRMVTTTN